MRHDPTLHLNKNDSMVTFSQSSQYCTIETFLQRHLDFTLYIILFHWWLEVEDLNWNWKNGWILCLFFILVNCLGRPTRRHHWSHDLWNVEPNCSWALIQLNMNHQIYWSLYLNRANVLTPAILIPSHLKISLIYKVNLHTIGKDHIWS